ncbi:MAG: helix-turn-helix transcriptional regulator [Clostridium sp.]
MKNRHSEKDNKVRIVINYTRHYRKIRKLTQKDVAEIIEVTPQRFANIETNKNITNIIRVMAIAKVLKVKVDDLYKQRFITKEQYNKLRVMNRDIEPCKELEEAHVKLDMIYKIEDKSKEVIKEIEQLNKIIRKKSIFRYGNVLEFEEWEKILNDKQLYKIR